MANLIEVNTNQLGKDTRILKQRVESIKLSLKGLYAEMDELNAMWDGLANEEFNARFKEDSEVFEDICTELGKIAEDMGHARQEYDNCEARVASMVSSMRI